MHGYARGIAGVLAADFIWSTGYAVPSTVLDSTIDYLNYATGIGIMKYCILCGVATTRDLCINYCATSLPV